MTSNHSARGRASECCRTPYNFGITDLDELVLKCRNKNAKELIAEAVICYKAGANRSAIVAAWNAVVYDFVEKLRKLELTGDANARTKLEQFERLISNSDYKGLLEYERQVLTWARDDFQFITRQEFDDLGRLRNDRHRCAHPSMLDVAKVFMPPAELARLHIRSAVVHMLQNPPVQGKAALDLIWQKIASPYFPTETPAAKEQLMNSPLNRARASLVRGVVITLLKETNTATRYTRVEPLAAALNATAEMYTPLTLEIIEVELNRILDGCADSNLGRVVALLAKVPLLQSYVNTAMTDRLRRYVTRYDGTVEFTDGSYATNPDEIGVLLTSALKVPDLRVQALARAEDMTDAVLQRALEADPSSEIIEIFVRRFDAVGNYSSADSLVDNGQLKLITPYVSGEQVGSLILSFIQNSQLNGAGTVQEPLTELVRARSDLHGQLKDILKNNLSVSALYSGSLVSHFGASNRERFVELLKGFLPADEVSVEVIG